MSAARNVPRPNLRLINCEALRAEAARRKDRFSKRAEEKLRPIFVKAHRGEIRRLLVVYQETEDSPPICVSNEDNIGDAFKMAMKGSLMLDLARSSDE